jgi:lia operon protein LiaG
VRPSSLSAIAAALLLASPLAAQERHVLTGASATIWNLAGTVRMEAGTGTDVAVEVTRGGSDGERLTVNASGGQLRVRYPSDDIVYREDDRGRSTTTLTVRDDGSFGGGFGSGGRRVRVRSYGNGLEAHADLRVSVPRGKRVEIHLAAGEVSVVNVDGDLRLDVHAARVRATGTKGRLSVDAGSGSVQVDEAEGELDVNTGSGSTRVTGFRGASLSVDAGSGSITARDVTVERFTAEAGSGRVSADGLATDDLRVDTGSGGVELSLTRVPRSSNIDTGSGSVRLALPADANADLEISTGSGRISSDFAVTMDRIERRALRGRLGDGGPRIMVDTGSGSVRLVKR